VDRLAQLPGADHIALADRRPREGQAGHAQPGDELLRAAQQLPVRDAALGQGGHKIQAQRAGPEREPGPPKIFRGGRRRQRVGPPRYSRLALPRQQLPVGHGRKYANNTNGFVNTIIGGWQAQTILVVRSGTPFTPTVSPDRANTGVASQRPNLNPADGNPAFQRTLANWYDRSRYVVAPIYTYGQVRANTLRSGTYNQFDASVFKNFALPGESTLSFRAEFFNFPNTVSFAAPNNNSPTSPIDTATGAQITSTSNTQRSIQFALKYNF